MKQLLAIMMCLLLLSSQQVIADPQLSISSVELSQGATGSVNLSLSGGTEPYAGVNARILVPEGVTITNVSRGELLPPELYTVQWQPYSGAEGTGIAVVAYSSTTAISEASGVLLTLDLQVAVDAVTGAYAISFGTTNENPLINVIHALSNADGSVSVLHTIADGMITITGGSPTGSISGQVIAGGAGGLEGAVVTVIGTELYATTYANGEFTISDVPAGTYTLRVESDGFESVEVPDVVVVEGQAVIVPVVDMLPCSLPGWSPVVYTNSTTLYCCVSIDGQAAVEGDMVAAFVGDECRAVQPVVINEGIAYATLVIAGNVVETATFKIFDSSECVVYDVRSTSLETDPGNTIGGYPNCVEIDHLFVVDQSISLNAGWNLISMNVELDGISPATIFAVIIDELVEVKNIDSSYNPDVPDFLNTLVELLSGYGYWVRMDTPQDLTVSGEVAECATPIDINAGWNLIGYPCQSGQGVEAAFSSLIAGSTLVEVKSINESYNPNVPDFLNTLESIEPNEGYWLRASSAAIFTYPIPPTKSPTCSFDQVSASCVEEVWAPVIYSDSTTAYGIVTIGGVPASEGDVVAAFVAEECRARANVVVHEGAAYTTVIVSGEVPEEVKFKVYDASAEAVYEVEGSVSSDPGNTIGMPPGYLDLSASFPASVADVILTPTSHDFGAVPLGGIADHEFTISNQGTADLMVSDIMLGGDHATEFALNLDGGVNPCGSSSLIIPEGESRTFVVSFEPGSLDAKTASIQIHSNDLSECNAIVPLTGYGENKPPVVTWSVPADDAVLYSGCGVTDISIGFSEDVRGSGGSQITAQDFAVNGSSAAISNFAYDGASHVVSFTVPELEGVSWHTIQVNGAIEDTGGKKLAGNVAGATPGLNHHCIDVGILRGDFQQDYDVDVFDRTQFLASWTTQNGSTGADLEADYQCDSDVDVFDRTQFLANWTVANGQDIGAPPSH